MIILAIDPGNTKSAYMLFDGKPTLWDIVPNDDMLSLIAEHNVPIIVEMVASYGMAVGAEVFETVYWIGRYIQHAEWCNLPHERLFRKDCKMHLCHDSRAKDANIRQALIDLYGGDSIAIGGKKCQACKGKGVSGRPAITCKVCGGDCYELPPGPLKGISADCWAALAVAQTWWDTRREKPF